jgi:hypothetical protein
MLSSFATRPLTAAGGQQRSFHVGQNREGLWVAVETTGVAGGIFKSRDAALHYAAFETDRRPGAVRFVAEPIELKV